MAASLILRSATPAETIELNLSSYLQLQPGTQMDPYNPAFTNKVFSHSLLKEGGTLALESLALKELQFPLRLKAASGTALAELIEQLNKVINSPGATAAWQDEGMSQATVFDLASGQFDLTYTFREAAQQFQAGLLRLFSQPLGRTPGVRRLATASGVGPLLMISPYASSGEVTIAASEQAGVKGFGGKQQPSGGVFYWGNPSLAGDAAARLQISYVGPLPNKASSGGEMPYAFVSTLPDQNYNPLFTVQEFKNVSPSQIANQTAVASEYQWFTGEGEVIFEPFPKRSPVTWAGAHRVLAIARASEHTGSLQWLQSPMTPLPTASVTVSPGDWQLIDMGTITCRPSALAPNTLTIAVHPAGGAVDITALIMLPDATTWALSPKQIKPENFAWPLGAAKGSQNVTQHRYTNSFFLDDLLEAQFMVPIASQTTALAPSQLNNEWPLTPFSRGQVPRPVPAFGMPILAIVGIGQNFVASAAGAALITGASWANPQNLQTMAQVTVQERFRYVSG